MRQPWDEYFIRFARQIAERATCDRKHVGCVIVNENRRVIATGYNGSPAGLPHCDDVGHLLVKIDGRDSCIRTLHAESNAMDHAGSRALGSTFYITCAPCYECSKRIINAGVSRVVYAEKYSSRNSDLVADLFFSPYSKTVLELISVDDRHDEQGEPLVCSVAECANDARYRDSAGTIYTRCGIHAPSDWIRRVV